MREEKTARHMEMPGGCGCLEEVRHCGLTPGHGGDAQPMQMGSRSLHWAPGSPGQPNARQANEFHQTSRKHPQCPKTSGLQGLLPWVLVWCCSAWGQWVHIWSFWLLWRDGKVTRQVSALLSEVQPCSRTRPGMLVQEPLAETQKCFWIERDPHPIPTSAQRGS